MLINTSSDLPAGYNSFHLLVNLSSNQKWESRLMDKLWLCVLGGAGGGDGSGGMWVAGRRERERGTFPRNFGIIDF